MKQTNGSENIYCRQNWRR